MITPSDDILRVDPLRLDEQLQEQPVLMWHWAQEQADAARDLGEAERLMKLTEAELKKKVRAHPDLYKLTKEDGYPRGATEDGVEAAVISQPDYQIRKQELIEAQHRYDLCRALTLACIDRKHAIQASVELHLVNYGSEVKPRKHGTTETFPAEELRGES